METSESEQETEIPLQVTILDTVQKSKSVEKIFSENVSFDEFDKEFNDIPIQFSKISSFLLKRGSSCPKK